MSLPVDGASVSEAKEETAKERRADSETCLAVSCSRRVSEKFLGSRANFAAASRTETTWATGMSIAKSATLGTALVALAASLLSVVFFAPRSAALLLPASPAAAAVASATAATAASVAALLLRTERDLTCDLCTPKHTANDMLRASNWISSETVGGRVNWEEPFNVAIGACMAVVVVGADVITTVVVDGITTESFDAVVAEPLMAAKIVFERLALTLVKEPLTASTFAFERLAMAEAFTFAADVFEPVAAETFEPLAAEWELFDVWLGPAAATGTTDGSMQTKIRNDTAMDQGCCCRQEQRET
mmetsp:Transcript_26743/g.88892  ORF Transcript_26743/g.88892 Transcript_26743/m.88892 type:complete len:303 (+) Transcript_26743:1569-2477(+)